MPSGGKLGRPFQLKLELWNAAGSENYRFLTKAFYNEVDAVVFIYSVDYLPSFEALSALIDDFNQIN